MTNNPTYFDLLEACAQPGCPACRLEQRYVEHYLDHLLYENVNDSDLRDILRLSLGFCHEHAWLAVNQRLGDALGFAIIYQDVFGAVLERLDKDVPPPTRRWAGLFKRIPAEVGSMVYKAVFALTPQKPCPACQNRDEMLSMIVGSLVENLGKQEMVGALQVSDGLCISHLQMALKDVRDVVSCEKLIAIHREKLEALCADLAELIRKNDYRFMKEGFGPEGNSWLRAITFAVGNNKKKD